MTSSPTFQRVHLGADRPDDAGRVGAGNVEGLLVDIERRDRLAEARPDAVVIDAAGHHEDEDLVLADRPGRHHLELQRRLGRAVPVLADRPGVHLLGNMTERRDFADPVKVLQRSNFSKRGSRHCLSP